MKAIVCISMMAVLGLAIVAPQAGADGTVTGQRNSLFVSASDFYVPAVGNPPAIVASGQILRGKRKHVVAIDVSLTDNTFPPAGMAKPGVQVTVNGFPAEPTLYPLPGSHFVINACPQAACTVGAKFFFDLDEMETRSPGTFIGQPLNVEVRASDYSFVGFSRSIVVLEAVLQRK